MDCSTPGLPVLRQPTELTETHVHWVDDAIRTSHPLSYLSVPAFSLSQHQGLFQWVSSMHQVAKVLEFQLHISPFNEYSGLIFFGMDWLYLLAVLGLFIFFFLLFTFLLLLHFLMPWWLHLYMLKSNSFYTLCRNKIPFHGCTRPTLLLIDKLCSIFKIVNNAYGELFKF